MSDGRLKVNTKNAVTIHWIVDGLTGDENSGYSSRLASTRYRAILPARELRVIGHRVDLIDARRWRWDPQRRPDVVVVGKLLRYGSDDDFLRHCDTVFAQLAHARESGVPFMADFCDDHFSHPLLGGPWRSLANQATLCTASSQLMADVISRHTARPVVVIGDPLLSPAGEPRVFEPERGLHRVLARWRPNVFKRRLRLVWFGHPNSFPPMVRWAEDLVGFSANRPITLTVVTGPNGQDTRSLQHIEQWIDSFNLAHAPRIIVNLSSWSEDSQWRAVNQADLVLIPSQVHNEDARLKSSNRLTDALNAGRYVVASVVPSYRPFDAYCSLTDEPAKALQWVIQNPAAARGRIEAGQKIVQELVSVEVVAREWAQAAIQVASTASDQIASFSFPVESDELISTESSRHPLSIGGMNQPQSGNTANQHRQLSAPHLVNLSLTRLSLLEIHVGKAGKVSDKWEAYFPAYERLFSPLRDQKINLLEIGVQNGGSLEVWAHYFANAGRIIGCDVDPKCAGLRYADPRIEVIIGDASAPITLVKLKQVCDSFDIIIDDGSHLSSDILSAFLGYFPLLKPGGLYVIEDTHALYRAVPGGGVLSEASAHQFFKLCAELINREHWIDQLPAETLMSTFIPQREDFPEWLKHGVIESVEFRNSMVVIRKTEPGMALGRRLIAGEDALVHTAVLRHKDYFRG